MYKSQSRTYAPWDLCDSDDSPLRHIMLELYVSHAPMGKPRLASRADPALLTPPQNLNLSPQHSCTPVQEEQPLVPEALG